MPQDQIQEFARRMQVVVVVVDVLCLEHCEKRTGLLMRSNG